jgi:uncharacterized repeat protein (TIGR03803 family)
MSCTPVKHLTRCFGRAPRSLAAILSVLFGLGAATPARAQTFSVVYNFGSLDGDPLQQFYSGVIAQGRDANLYSGSSAGGAIGYGATYKFTPAGVMTTLYSFSNSTDGSYPYGGLTMGTDGNFYGTSYSGGFGGAPYGTVFKMTSSGGYTLLYTFTDGADGALPIAPPIQGTDSNFYGTTCTGCNGGAASGYGSIYKITPAGVFSPLYSCDGTHCDDPNGPLVQGKDGNFYGTSEYGGTGYGNVFKITPGGKISTIYNFSNSDGAYPIAGLVQGSDGNFYGTTVDGGSTGLGEVFRVTPAGKLTVLHAMNGTTDGSAPFGGLVQATDGNFYGANAYGGVNNDGTLFEITPTGTFSVLHSFDGADGQLPYSGVMQHTNGVIYGGTQLGGTGTINCSGNCGVLYSWTAPTLIPFAALVSTSGKVGAKIGILGQNFSSSSVVTFGSVAATAVTRIGSTFLQATVPSRATTGSVTVTTTSGTLTSNKKFRVTPQIKSFTPPSGPVGTVVTITGVSLTQTTKVTFGGVAATSFTVNSDTQVTATVPVGAKTGKIVITTPGGTASSATSFTVT